MSASLLLYSAIAAATLVSAAGTFAVNQFQQTRDFAGHPVVVVADCPSRVCAYVLPSRLATAAAPPARLFDAAGPRGWNSKRNPL